jgi:hypothetical protein
LNKLLFTIPLAILLIPFVYAEKVEIDVPFDQHGYNCTILDTVNELTYTCIFEGNIQTFTLQDLKEFESILTDKQIDEIIESLNQEKLKQIEIEKAKLTPNEQLIYSLEQKRDNGGISSQDIILLHMIKELELCYQGLGRSEAIQTYNEFEITNYLNYKFNHIEVVGKIGNIVKQMEVCKAQHTLENKTLSQRYQNLVVNSEDIQFNHRDQFKGISAIPFEKFTATSTEIDMSAICDNNQQTRQYKDMMGCGNPIIYDGYTLDKSDGVINYYSSSMEKYQTFMKDYGNIQATAQDKQIEIDKATVIKEKLLQENTWYYK